MTPSKYPLLRQGYGGQAKRCQNCNDRNGIKNVLDTATQHIMHLCGKCYKALKEQLDYRERYR